MRVKMAAAAAASQRPCVQRKARAAAAAAEVDNGVPSTTNSKKRKMCVEGSEPSPLAIDIATNALHITRARALHWLNGVHLCSPLSAFSAIERFVRTIHLRDGSSSIDWVPALSEMVGALVRDGFDVDRRRPGAFSGILNHLLQRPEPNMQLLIEAMLPFHAVGVHFLNAPPIWHAVTTHWPARLLTQIVNRSMEWELNSSFRAFSPLGRAVVRKNEVAVQVLLEAANDDGSGVNLSSTSNVWPAADPISVALRKKRDAIAAFPGRLNALLHGLAADAMQELGIRQLICEYTVIPTVFNGSA